MPHATGKRQVHSQNNLLQKRPTMLRNDRQANSEPANACALDKSLLGGDSPKRTKKRWKSIVSAAIAALGLTATDSAYQQASAQQFDPYGSGYTQTTTPSQYQVQPGYSTPPSYTNSPTYTSPPTTNYPPAQTYVPPPVPQTTVPSTSFPPQSFGPRQRVLLPGNSVPGSGTAYPPIGTDPVYTPNVRVADLIINGFPARTGRIMLGGAVNSDAGVTGQITVDERNFDIMRWPRSFSDLFSGTAFRGAGQTFRLEAAPGSVFDRYSMQFADPNLFGYLPISFSASGFLYDRRFDDWDEERLGARFSLGYRITPDLSLAVGVGGQNVDISRIRLPGVSPELDALVGDNELYTGNITLTHNTRDNPIQPSEGHYFQFKFEEAFGDFDYARFELEYRTYWLLAQRADGSGKQTVSYSTQFGYSGDETPIFEHFFAGGYATLRGFDFRGAGPVEGGANGIQVGGQFQWLNSVEYMFPITADDAFRGVVFCDFGTVEDSVKLDSDTFRVAPGVGFRVAIPALGPAPLAFDFAFPVNKGEFDDERMFSFYMSLIK
ncbi:BamA/TamA family outer membrane protein [Stieleria sp. JC731]|nr:BamA/TamA family outer membrane protein [Stieleria sp. JC731]MCC9601778.1 BamA/TamA family outer membrane protein [Stieleria sp. JC731]